MKRTSNLRIRGLTPVIAPADLKQVFPLSASGAEFVTRAREQITDILYNRDGRLMVVVGPCSIHDPRAALEYAGRLAKLARDGKLLPDDFAGGTITLTNPGTIGTVASVPRLMKGQGAIIGVGALEYPAEWQGASHCFGCRGFDACARGDKGRTPEQSIQFGMAASAACRRRPCSRSGGSTRR